jgi:hypothetical protein
MGLMRKSVKIVSFGLAPIHYRDKEEREIKATQRVLAVQRESLKEQRMAAAVAYADATADAPVDQLERLERIGRLHDQGVLSDAEFAAQKAQILKPARRGPRDWRR